MENSYSRILKLMKEEGAKFNPPSIEIAIVTKESPDLRIKIRDLELYKENLLIADYLLENYTRKIAFSDTSPGGITLSGGDPMHNHGYSTLEVKADFITKCTLKLGDRLAVLPTSDRQTFIVLARLSEVM